MFRQCAGPRAYGQVAFEGKEATAGVCQAEWALRFAEELFDDRFGNVLAGDVEEGLFRFWGGHRGFAVGWLMVFDRDNLRGGEPVGSFVRG